MASVMLYLGKLKGLEVLSTGEPKYARKPNDSRVRPVDWDFGLELREGMADKSGEENLVNLKPDDRFNLKTFANQRIGILIEGETGVGKTRLARLIHEWSGRDKDRFREQNCAAFHGVELNMAKSEWFGHKKGAYTGGNFDRAGIFMEADGGTVFLDEVGELVPAMQSLLLKILEDKIICPLGGKKEDEKKVDVQIIAATNRDLIREVRAGRFRSDLYYRLSEYPVSLDTLRELSLPIREKLVKDLAIEVIKERNPPGRDLSTAALKLMAAHSWPGNFRQMKQSLVRLLLTSRGPVVDEDRVRAELGRPTPETLLQSGERESAPWDGLPLREAVDIFRYQKVQAALNEHNTKTNAAKSLGISVQTLNDYLEAIESKEPSKNGS
jgi:transcriptional regulator with PAS, ATPase and Fis domain